MATVLLNTIPSNSSLANFKAWAQGISNALATFGWVQTADTGQINWATVTAPVGGAIAGYEIWRMNDVLQATVPVFMKVQYGGNVNNGTTQPALYIQVCSQTDGAGGAVGGTGWSTLLRIIGSQSGTLATVTGPQYMSGDNNRFSLAAWNQHPTSDGFCIIASVERTKDVTGADTGEGVLLFGTSHNANSAVAGTYASIVYDSATRTTAPPCNDPVGMVPFGAISYTFGSDLGFGPVIHAKGRPMQSGMGVLQWKVPDIAYLTLPVISLYGANHTYIAVKALTLKDANTSHCVRYE